MGTDSVLEKYLEVKGTEGGTHFVIVRSQFESSPFKGFLYRKTLVVHYKRGDRNYTLVVV